MQQSEEMSGESKEALSDAVNETLGNPEEIANSASENPNQPENDELPEFAKRRLGMQEKRHKKEMRKKDAQLEEMRSYLNSRPEQQSSPMNGMDTHMSQESGDSNINSQVYAAVAKVMQLKDEQERKQRELENAQHVYKRKQELSDHLDKYSDKYDDFDDVIRASDAPFTDTMQGIAMILHKIPGMDVPETLYRLGKDKNKLHELSKLKPMDQAEEVLKIAISLMQGSKDKSNGMNNVGRSLGQVKNNPVSSSNQINDKSSVGEIRKRMKEGGRKWGG